MSRPRDLSRRMFLAGGVGIGAAAAVAGCSAAAPQVPAARFVSFEGVHQSGITALPVPARGLMAAFNVHAGDRAALTRLLRELTDESRGLMSGRPPTTRDPAFPPADSGVLGANPPPDDLSIVALRC